MKVFIRTLQNNKYELEVSPEESILSVKEKVQSTHGLAAPELQKLIFNGKVLKDDQTLQQAKVKEGGFIVLMVSKKQTPKPLPEPQIPAATPSSEPQIPASTPPSSEPQIASAAPSSAPQVLQSAASDLARGPAYEQIVSQLMDLGFPRDQVVRCLAAGFNNPERAVEYLLGGIPAHLMSENPAQNAAAQPAADQIPADLADDGSVGDEIDEAQMAQELAALQQALQQNPQMLQQMIAVLAQQYPELVPYLGNREIVMKLLQDPAM